MVEQAESLRDAKKTFDMIWGRVSQKLAQLRPTEAERMALAIQREEKAELIRRLAQVEADKAVKAAAIVPGTALEAVRRVVEAWWNHEPHDVEVHEAMDNLRTAFGLEPKK